jgi:sigma-B regulation protein RsbQ
MTEDVAKCYNINVWGNGTQPMMFAHGLGCDQNMWRFITPAFQNKYKILAFDYIGCGQSDLSYYNEEKYGSLQGYAQDILDIADAFKLKDIILVAHSVSCMIGLLAAISRPEIFNSIIMVGPSA